MNVLKRVCGVLLAFCLVAGTMPLIAEAAEGNNLVYDSASGSLTLNGSPYTENAEKWEARVNGTTGQFDLVLKDGFNFVCDSNSPALEIVGDTVLIIEGANNIITSENGDGIHSAGNLKITGTGSLAVTAGTAVNSTATDTNTNAGISVALSADKKLTVGEQGGTGPALRLAGAEKTVMSCGIYSGYSENGGIDIYGGTVEAYGNNLDENSLSCGIYLEGSSLNIQGGTVSAFGRTDGDNSSGTSAGIYLADHTGDSVIKGKITLEAGTLNAGGGRNTGDSARNEERGFFYGICSTGAIEIKGGSLNAFGGNINRAAAISPETEYRHSIGIYSAGTMIIGGGKVTAEGGEPNVNGSSIGFYSDGTFTMNGGVFNTLGGNMNPVGSYGIYSYGTFNFNSGTITAKAGTTNGKGGSYGFLGADVNLSGGTLVTDFDDSGDGAAFMAVSNLSLPENYILGNAEWNGNNLTKLETGKPATITVPDYTLVVGTDGKLYMNESAGEENEITLPNIAVNTTDSTITLNGFNFSTPAAIAMAVPDGFKLLLTEGTANEVKSTYAGSSGACGIYSDGSFEVSGSGKLNISAKDYGMKAVSISILKSTMKISAARAVDIDPSGTITVGSVEFPAYFTNASMGADGALTAVNKSTGVLKSGNTNAQRLVATSDRSALEISATKPSTGTGTGSGSTGPVHIIKPVDTQKPGSDRPVVNPPAEKPVQKPVQEPVEKPTEKPSEGIIDEPAAELIKDPVEIPQIIVVKRTVPPKNNPWKTAFLITVPAMALVGAVVAGLAGKNRKYARA